jgi:hypothetical protein
MDNFLDNSVTGEYPTLVSIQRETPDGIIEIRMRIKAKSEFTHRDFTGKWTPILEEGCK